MAQAERLSPGRERMLVVVRLLTKAISTIDPDGMPTADLGQALYKAGNVGDQRPDQDGICFTERVIRLGGAFMAWADGHYLMIDQDQRDRWLVAGIDLVQQMPDGAPDLDPGFCTLGATFLTHVLNDRPRSMMDTVDGSITLAEVVDGQANSHAALTIALRVLMQCAHPNDQRVAMAQALNLAVRIFPHLP